MGDMFKSVKVVALRGLVAFPGMKINFEIGRERTVKTLLKVIDANERHIFLVSQKSADIEIPDFDDLADTGVLVSVEQIVRDPAVSTIRITAQGLERGVILRKRHEDGCLCGDIMLIGSQKADNEQIEVKAMTETLKDLYDEYAEISGSCPKETLIEIFDSDDLDRLTFLIASVSIDNYKYNQRLLDESDAMLRGKMLCKYLRELIEVQKIKREIEKKTQISIDKSQREYYLHEEMRVISEELGEDSERECDEFKKEISSKELPESTREKLLKECDRLMKVQSFSPEANVIRTYLEEVLALPWGKYTEDNTDIEKAKRILDRSHYGLDKVKERFIEMLCTNTLGASPSGQILCLIGPPGTGKTSVSKAAAKAMGRSFARISLGGVGDEAEIRGHRKTYIGSMPGRIINAVKQAGSSNAFILLDEIDKLSKDYKGDPASALLEVLDGEQNNAFTDHYIEAPFDLSKIIFVTTANDASSIPEPLYDRMEKIEIEGYTFEEKIKIAQKHLVKKQLKAYGLTPSQVKITKSALEEITERYTREAGVRALEKHIATVCRKAAVKIAEGEQTVTVSKKDVEEYLNKPRYIESVIKENRVGVVNGLAWTSAGGDVLTVEAAVMDGTGKTEITGNLGDVMKESARIAVSIVRGICSEYGIENDFYKSRDIHLHFPMGAVPKDGPSAGVTVTTALVSALSGKKVRGDIAMTGEVSLSGRVMPIGGLKEKAMAAYKNKISTVIIPKENTSDLCDVSDEVKSRVKFIPVDSISQVLKTALIQEGTV